MELGGWKYFWSLDAALDLAFPLPTQTLAQGRDDDPVAALCEGRTIWNSDGTDGPCLICPP